MKAYLAAAVALLSVLAAGAGGAGAASTTFVVHNALDAGQFSLRWAIDQANANPGADTIVFQLPTPAQTISITSAPLPVITEAVTIDGRTQPGFADTPLIRIDNGTGNASAVGLEVAAGSTKIRSLDITGFGVGIQFETGGANLVAGNIIGLDLSGAAAGNDVGVLVQGGSVNNVVGGTGVKSRNVISGNTTYGVQIGGAGVTGNVVLGNYIGTSLGGGGARANGIGVYLSSTDANTIGGSTSFERNVISGNTTDGVVLDSGATNTTVSANYVGLNADGTGALPNGRYGVRLSGGAHTNKIGKSNAPNVISGNGSAGVALLDSGTTANRVISNFIGTDPTGASAVANTGDGIAISGGATSNTVGGAGASVRNVISGNTLSGVSVSGAASTKNQILGNYIGTNAAGSAAVANGQNGVTVSGSATHTDIGMAVAGNGNVISGNTGWGVVISGLAPASGDTSNNTVAGNLIGTAASGAAALGNGQDGVLIDSTAANKIGGSTQPAARNVISGNKQIGVDIRGAGSTGNKVQGNYIGTDVNGTAALGNVKYGVAVQSGADGNTVGGNLTKFANVISGNKISGVIVRGSGTDANLVQGNLVGTNASGTAAVPNVQHGVEMTMNATNTTVGGTLPDLRNVISGNGGSGVRVLTGSTGTQIQGNFIGTDMAGTAAVGNSVNGVHLLGTSGTLVGGLSAKAKNVIEFNGGAGVKVDGTGGTANANQLLGNSIDGNGGLGIQLVGGANHDQAAPVITQVKTDVVRTTIKGQLTSLPSKTFRIEVFSSPTCDPSGAGEGATFLGFRTITTDVNGQWTFSIQVSPVASGLAITETATRQDVTDTSGFSTCVSSP